MFKSGLHHIRDIRKALTEHKVCATDKRARFVTVAAYEAAGGTIERELFTEEDEGVYLLDAQLLDQHAHEKLQAVADTVKEEGWKWVEAHAQFSRWETDLRTRYPEPLPSSDELQAEQAALVAEYNTLYNSAKEPDEAGSTRLHEIDEIDNSAENAYTADTLAIAGAVVTIGHNGEAEIVRGLVRHEDEPEADDTSEPSEQKERSEYSAKLLEDLTQARSAAIGAALCAAPDIALASVVHVFVVQVFSTHSGSSLQVTARATPYRQDCKGAGELRSMLEGWGDQIPVEETALWGWCLAQGRDTLLSLLAFCAGCSVDAVHRKADRADSLRLTHANRLATALNLDLAQWFSPTAESFFSRVGRATVVKAIVEAKGLPAKRTWDKLEKADLAALAEREVAGTGWLPLPLRAAA